MGLCCCTPYSFYIPNSSVNTNDVKIPGLSIKSDSVNMPGLSVNTKKIKILKLSTIGEDKFEVLNDDEFNDFYI